MITRGFQVEITKKKRGHEKKKKRPDDENFLFRPFLYFFFSFMSEKSDLFKTGGVLGS